MNAKYTATLFLDEQANSVLKVLESTGVRAYEVDGILSQACVILLTEIEPLQTILYSTARAEAQALYALLCAFGLTATDEDGALKDLILAVQDKLERMPVTVGRRG